MNADTSGGEDIMDSDTGSAEADSSNEEANMETVENGVENEPGTSTADGAEECGKISVDVNGNPYWPWHGLLKSNTGI